MAEPNPAEWISAWSSVAAAFGTIGALWVGAIAFLRQTDASRREQASAVSILQIGPAEVSVINQSNKAIHAITPWHYDGPNPAIERYDPCPCDTAIDVLPAGQTFETRNSRVPVELHHSAIPFVDFTDANGLRWRRARDGELTLLKKMRRKRSQLRNRAQH